MAITFANIKTGVEERGDGGSFDEDKHALWANNLRKDLVMDFDIAGLNGLYFLYREATVQGGSVESQAKYAIPDDLIDHLQVFYDGTLLTDAPKKLLSVTHPSDDDGTPGWVNLLGLEFELVPAPDTAAKEIKLLYNGLPSDVPSASNDDYTDYFLNHWPNLHIFGMSEQAWEYLGGMNKATYYGKKFKEQKAKLMYHNRRHWMKNANLRFANWVEYSDYKRTVFPQIQDT
jgi:hypothetical protein